MRMKSALSSWMVEACAADAAMVAEVRGVFDTLTYPHLILPYSAYYLGMAT